MKYVRCTLLLLVMILLLTACGTQDAESPAATGPLVYRVTVWTERGEPVKGAMVQLCSNVCIPGITDEQGTAAFEVAEDDYKVSFLSMPEGYDYADETREFLFEKESRELTILLKETS